MERSWQGMCWNRRRQTIAARLGRQKKQDRRTMGRSQGGSWDRHSQTVAARSDRQSTQGRKTMDQ